jgi:hypothetical protein
MGRQVELIQRELFHEREQKAQLELIEGDLVHKLQVLEGETLHLRAQVQSCEFSVHTGTAETLTISQVLQTVRADWGPNCPELAV